MKKLLDVLNKIEVVGASIVLAGLIAFTFVGVPMRYLMSHPFTWEEELQLACMVWITFLLRGGLPVQEHVAIEIVVDALPAGLRRAAEVLIAVVVYVVLIYFLLRSHNIYRGYAENKPQNTDSDDSVFLDLFNRSGLHRADADQLYGRKN